jgi:polyphosphate:AMP phosphotransferase
MLEKVTESPDITKKQFDALALELHPGLLALQQRLRAAKFPAIIVIAGMEGAGKTETLNFLLGWLDTRSAHVQAFRKETDEERSRPYYWRFWRALPKKGETGIFLGGWYSDAITGHALGRTGEDEFTAELEKIKAFESALAGEGALILKFWLHLSEDEQEKRLKRLEKDKDSAWRVTKKDWKCLRRYDDFYETADAALAETSTPDAPWKVIHAAHPHYRNIEIAKAITDRLERMLDRAPAPKNVPDHPKPRTVNALRSLDFTKALAPDTYEKELAHWGARVAVLTRELNGKKRSLVVGFEGTDAAGKGGAIRRLTQFMDARDYRVVPIAAPTDEERAMPWLWRFWRHIPMRGGAVIFDRTWYGRVLVERVEGFCSKKDWTRAYGEINEFEAQLAEKGAVVLKFWLATSKSEQLKRFKLREATEWKKFKITDEDWRNRDKWDYYEAAACDMFARTSRPAAPWVLVESECKLHARVKVLRTVAQALQKALE